MCIDLFVKYHRLQFVKEQLLLWKQS